MRIRPKVSRVWRRADSDQTERKLMEKEAGPQGGPGFRALAGVSDLYIAGIVCPEQGWLRALSTGLAKVSQ